MSHSGLEENIRRRYISESDGALSHYSDEQLTAMIRQDRPTEHTDVTNDDVSDKPYPVHDRMFSTPAVTNASIAAVDGKVYTELLNRFTDMMISKIVNISLCGLDAYDLMQECSIGLLCAALSYNGELGASFATYASRCIDNRIYSAMKTSRRKKHMPLNGYAELSEMGDSVLIDPESDPETRTLIDESVGELTVQMSLRLSRTEHDVFVDSLNGLSYEQTANHLNISVKSVDNALQRARRKLRSHFKGAESAQ